MNTTIKKLLIGLEIGWWVFFVVAADMILMENNNYSMKTCTGDMHVFTQNRSFLEAFFNSVIHFINIDPVI